MCFYVLIQYVSQAAERVNLFNLWTWAISGNFLKLYMWGGSRSAGGNSCSLLCSGCLLCGYNVAGQVYCLKRGCAVLLLHLWAGHTTYDAQKLSLVGSGSKKTVFAHSRGLTWPEMMHDVSLLSSEKDGLQWHPSFKCLDAASVRCIMFTLWKWF